MRRKRRCEESRENTRTEREPRIFSAVLEQRPAFLSHISQCATVRWRALFVHYRNHNAIEIVGGYRAEFAPLSFGDPFRSHERFDDSEESERDRKKDHHVRHVGHGDARDRGILYRVDISLGHRLADPVVWKPRAYNALGRTCRAATTSGIGRLHATAGVAFAQVA